MRKKRTFFLLSEVTWLVNCHPIFSQTQVQVILKLILFLLCHTIDLRAEGPYIINGSFRKIYRKKHGELAEAGRNDYLEAITTDPSWDQKTRN